MSPYYADEWVTLYLGDCLAEDVAPLWLSADVLVTDPPYGMAYQSGSRSARFDAIAGDATTEVRDLALALWGTARPALVFGTWRVPAPAGERQRLVWSKRNSGPGMGDLRLPWGTSHEEVYVLGQGWAHRGGGSVRRAASVIDGFSQMGNPHGEVSKAGHPTAKPVALLETLLTRCPPGVVADPFAGSGSTLLAARHLGRRSVGVEVEERYAEVVATRCAQGALVVPPAPRAEPAEEVPLW